MPETHLALLQARVDEARQALDVAVHARNRAIRAALTTGVSLRAIGKEIGLSSSGVRYISLGTDD